MSLVFAKHKDFSDVEIGKVLEAIEPTRAQIDDISVAEPMGKPPLQVADLIAYEVARDLRWRKRRYPLTRLKQLGGGFHFSEGVSAE